MRDTIVKVLKEKMGLADDVNLDKEDAHISKQVDIIL